MIVVTGAAGFIGSNLCIRLVEQGYQVYGIDALLAGSNLANLDPLMGLGVEFYNAKVDIRDEGHLHSTLDMFGPHECVIHLAAESHVDRSISGDKTFWETNVVGASNIMRWALKNNVKVINQITDEVYGPKETGESFEGDCLLPTSPYAASKAAQYLVGDSYYKTYGLPVISTFPANTYGPRQHLEKLIPKFITKLLAGEQVPLMKSSHFVRDWLPVDDHCDALIHLMKHGSPGEGYNIPGLGLCTNLSITQKLLGLTGRDESAILEVPDRKAHDSRYCVNGDKIKTLGWKIKHNFITYLQDTVGWYKTHGNSKG